MDIVILTRNIFLTYSQEPDIILAHPQTSAKSLEVPYSIYPNFVKRSPYENALSNQFLFVRPLLLWPNPRKVLEYLE